MESVTTGGTDVEHITSKGEQDAQPPVSSGIAGAIRYQHGKK